jgi:TRAP-type C4-dicarboxylate transport system permease small subunit
MMVLTIADVVLRKTISRSILGTVELSEFMMVILVFFGLAQTEITNGHVKVDLVMRRFGDRVQGVVDAITQFICFLLFGAATWATLVYSSAMRASKEVTQDLWIPKYPFIYVVAVGWALLGLVLFINFLMALGKVLRSWLR